MDGERIHYEVYIRRKAGAGWALHMASEDRQQAVVTAESAFREHRCVAAKVTKETLDPETREFKTVTIMLLGDADTSKKAKPKQEVEPLCVQPQDLYSGHARERIGRLLDAWLKRRGVTPFELLHRPDLAEALESSGIDLQHALQKVSIPDAEARGCSVHELIRTYLALVERTIQRLLNDGKKGRFLTFSRETFAATAARAQKEAEPGYLLGGGVAAWIADAKTWPEKVERLLDLADAARTAGSARGLALATIEQPLAEILGSKSGFREVLGDPVDLGALLAAMTRMAAPRAVEMLISMEPSVARAMPEPTARAARLAEWLQEEEAFGAVRRSLGKRILEELNSMRRLRPSDPVGEIEVMRALAMALTAAAGPLLPIEDVQSAFSTRSKMLVTGEFVEAYLGEGRSAREEAEALVWLTENVIGAANKRLAGQWLRSAVSSLRLENEFMQNGESPATRLAALAGLQRAIARSGLLVEDYGPIQAALGVLGGRVEAEAGLAQAVARAKAPVFQRLSLLLKLASGESAPLGPAADRARQEAMKLARADETRAELAKAPDQMDTMRGLIQQAGLAA